jgi:general secretion pathway protein B
MSYILDALKKADKERKRGTVPNLSTDQDPTPQKPKKRSSWLYILIVVLVINAGIFLFWLNPWKSQETTLVAKSPAVTTNDSPVTSPKQDPSDIKPLDSSTSIHPEKIVPPGKHYNEERASHELQPTMPSQKQAETHQQRQTVQTDITQEKELQDDSHQEKLSEEPATSSSTIVSPPSKESITSDEQESSTHPPSESRFIVYDLKSLPSSVKEDLPDINISVFVYSDDPSSRVVKINGQTVREGQELTDGLKVEKIVPEGVIFNYEDYRFRVRIR